jgi:hypothetical protein
MRTLVLSLAGDLGEQLDEVGQVIAEELGLEDQVLARVVCVQNSSEELGFADNAQCRPSIGALECHWPSVELLQRNAWWRRCCWRTRNAKLASPSVRPGSGWYRVPAFATSASVVVGPAKSLLANFTPLDSPDWYWNEPDAGAASPRRWVWRRACWRAARWAPRQAVERENMVKEGAELGAVEIGGVGNGWELLGEVNRLTVMLAVLAR